MDLFLVRCLDVELLVRVFRWLWLFFPGKGQCHFDKLVLEAGKRTPDTYYFPFCSSP